MPTKINTSLTPYVPDRIWLKKYPVRYAGCDFFARATLIRMASGDVLVHSPCPMDSALAEALATIGPVAQIVAPGSYHYFHVEAWQQAFPRATTWICPGVERKQPELAYRGVLGDEAPPGWAADIDQVTICARMMAEVIMLHRPSRTLLVVDIIENYGDHTPDVHWLLRVYWKLARMWNRPLPAPEYRFGWGDRAAVRAALERVLSWEFDRIVIAHGALIETRAKEVARQAWETVLS